jgi:BASS family bile acid:Na+ symporter
LKVLVSVAIPLAAFLTGLRVCRSDLGWLPKRPSLLARSLLATLVVVPIATVLLLQLLHVPELVRAGLTVMILAIGLGPPNALIRSRAADDRAISYELGLNLTLLVVSIGFLPLAVALHGAIFHHHLQLGAGQVASVVLFRELIPLALGIAVGRRYARQLEGLARHAGLFVNVVLLVVVVFALAATWRGLLGIGAAGWLASLAVALMAVVIGHALGGPDRETRGVLAAFSSVRFPALALLLVSVIPQGRRLIPVVLAYVIASAVVVAAYGAVTAARPRRVAAPVNA